LQDFVGFDAIDRTNAPYEQIGLSSGVNFDGLGELANKTGGVFLFAESPGAA
jgi:hypothetical protein